MIEDAPGRGTSLLAGLTDCGHAETARIELGRHGGPTEDDVDNELSRGRTGRDAPLPMTRGNEQPVDPGDGSQEWPPVSRLRSRA